MSYGAKSAIKKSGGPGYRVSPLEGLFWSEDPAAFTKGDKTDWSWRLLIRQPEQVDTLLVRRVVEDVGRRREEPAVRDVRWSRGRRGRPRRCCTSGHHAEAPTIARLHEYLAQQGLTFDGRRHKHHEIYLGDPRRAAPESCERSSGSPTPGEPAARSGQSRKRVEV